ncbi:hypothetical protein ACN47E_008868 [Coniothyrium glycines]
MACCAPDNSSPLSSAPASSPCNYGSDSDLSVLSRSPTPPAHTSRSFDRRAYISPSSSRRSSTKASPVPEDMPSPPSSNDEDPRPRKRRKTTDTRERTADFLDLSNSTINDEELPHLERLLSVLHKKKKIVVIAGAGISVSAGIPDFRSATGLFKSLKKEHKLKSSGKDLFDASVYGDDTSTATFHDMVRTLSQATKSAKPTPFHHLLATLAQEGRLMRLYTQNVDGIDTSMPPLRTQTPLPTKGPWPTTVQVHGGLDYMVCSKCRDLKPFDAGIFRGPKAPTCPMCLDADEARKIAEKRSHGIGCLRPRMVLYNEHNPDDVSIGSCTAYDMRMRPDAVIVAGTTLKVPGVRRIAREMCKIVRDRKDGVAIWLNNDPEPLGKDLEDAWDLVVKGPCDEVARHANMRKWDDPMDFKEVSDEDMSKIKQSKKVEIVIGTPKKAGVIRNAGQLTPGQSPRILPQKMIKEEPGTPSKKGTKRKSDGQMNLFGKAAAKSVANRPKAQPKKTTKTKNKTKKDAKKEAPAINHVFKATKGTVRSVSKLPTKAHQSSHSSTTATDSSRAQFVPKENVSDGIYVKKRQIPSTPKRANKLTQLKNEFLMPLSDVDCRNNGLPQRPEVESFTPRRTASEQLHEESAAFAAVSPTSDSRPSTASSQRHEIIRSDSTPKGMGNILC